MRFWDTSALVPLLVDEPTTPQMASLLRQDPDLTVWCTTRTECLSAVARAVREGLSASQQDRARFRLGLLAADWSEVMLSSQVQTSAERLLFAYELRAADALQLAAALDWCDQRPSGRNLVCRDRRPSEAALAEGFTVLP